MHRADKSRTRICAALALFIVAMASVSPGAKIQRVPTGSRPIVLHNAQDASDAPIEETVADLAVKILRDLIEPFEHTLPDAFEIGRFFASL